MTYRLPALGVAFALLVGCIPLTVETAPEKLALTVCRKHRACDTPAWEDVWGRDFADCVDDTTDFYEDAVDIAEALGFEVDLEEVALCRRDISAATCEEFEDGDNGPNCADMLEF